MDLEFQRAIGRRIDEAWKAAGIDSRVELARLAHFKDHNRIHILARGEAEPTLRPLMAIARVCNVTLDWLVSGSDEGTTSLMSWLERHRDTEDEAIVFMKSAPVRGYVTTDLFWDLVYQAWKHGLTAQEASAGAKATDTGRTR